jgi:GT2 family glycosyltransferase
MRVVVVDNASADASVERIGAAIRTEEWEPWVKLVQAPSNGGFAAGNNLGLREARDQAELVMLLNSDTVALPGAIPHCVSVMRADPSVGAMSCRLLNADGSTQNAARGVPTPGRLVLCALGLPWKLPRMFGRADPEQPWWNRDTQTRDVEWLGGAFLMTRGDLVGRIGLLDEDFFLYGEDIEFCHRVWKAGCRCLYDPTFAIVHLGGASSDPSRLSAAARNGHAWRGRYLVQRKCYGRAAEWLVRGCDTCAYALRLGAMRVLGRSGEPRYADIRAALRLLCGRLMQNAR